MNNQALAREWLDNGYLEIDMYDNFDEDYDELELLAGAWWEVIIPDAIYITDTRFGKVFLNPECYEDHSKVVIIDDPYWAAEISTSGIIDLPEGAIIVSHDYLNGATVETDILRDAITVDVLNIRTNYTYSVADCCGDNSNFITERESE